MRHSRRFVIPVALVLFATPARATLTVDRSFPFVDGQVSVMVESGTTLYFGGSFSTVGGLPRNNVAAVDLASGLPTDWNPNADAPVRALFVDGATVYAGGDFLHIGGAARTGIAALHAFTGAATAWNPGTVGRVLALFASNGVVYAGGSFTTLGGQGRRYLGSVDAATGLVTPWNPNPDGYVDVLASNGVTLFAGGTFTHVLGDARNALAAIDLPGGTLKAWNARVKPLGSAQILSLAVDAGTLYVGGQFSAMNGDTRTNLAALDLTTATATSWSPNPVGVTKAIAVRGSTVYAGGAGDYNWFGISDGTSSSVVFCNHHIGQIDAVTGTAADLSMPIYAFLNAMVADASGLHFGGLNVEDGRSASSVVSLVDPEANVGVDPRLDRDPGLALRARGLTGDLVVTFSLPDSRPARIDVFDVGGRRVLARDLVGAGTGEQVRTLGAHSLRPGLYLVRLSQGSRSVGDRAILLR